MKEARQDYIAMLAQGARLLWLFLRNPRLILLSPASSPLPRAERGFTRW